MSPSETGTCTEEESKEVNTSIRIDQQVKNNVSNVALSSVLNTSVITSQRPDGQYGGLKRKNVSMTPENELSKRCRRVPSTSKACPTCGKTYSQFS